METLTDLESVPDGRLWEAVAADDHGAFTALFERHAQSVWNYAYRLTGSWSAAEDVLSTTFLTAWRRRADVVLIRESALPWLYTVAANLVRNDHRRRNRFLRLVPKLVSTDESRDHAEELAEQDHTQQRLKKVLAAVDELPTAERQAVQLCLVGRMSTADAAELLGITEVSVRSRLSRARTRLRGMTEESFDE
ncbi:RNA polymerase sigma factor [Kutzneria buriramensis]|uniref:RNA polymerase sigma-70 factor (ECF subfamily) n=1 Tax=Kutzneria buriramensis TaxID=1045776 RepID=A0A3E0HYR2_9PSEU|nr:RNA polymerase sigma-70 factor (ECF subfamily) [Kutzneria buriramensis]